jgi:hypothetical protein
MLVAAGGLATVTHVPTRLRIPAIGVDAPVLPVGVQSGGGLAIPPDPADVGWWAGGGFPGQPTGAVVLAGHIDSAVSGLGASCDCRMRPRLVIVSYGGPFDAATGHYLENIVAYAVPDGFEAGGQGSPLGLAPGGQVHWLQRL